MDKEKLALTPAFVAALVEATYSTDQRPDPYHPSPEIEAVMDALWDYPDAECVARFSLESQGPPDWEPDFTDKLEGYLYGEHDDEADAERRLGSSL